MSVSLEGRDLDKMEEIKIDPNYILKNAGKRLNKSVENVNYEELLFNIDEALKSLGMSDSSIEYAPHIRQEFSNLLQHINALKLKSGYGSLIENDNWYFEIKDLE